MAQHGEYLVAEHGQIQVVHGHLAISINLDQILDFKGGLAALLDFECGSDAFEVASIHLFCVPLLRFLGLAVRWVGYYFC